MIFLLFFSPRIGPSLSLLPRNAASISSNMKLEFISSNFTNPFQSLDDDNETGDILN